MDRDLLLRLINEDDNDLLRIKTPTCPQSGNDRLISAFQEINEFIRENNREPLTNSEVVLEFRLGTRLESFRQNAAHIRLLIEYDTFKVLGIQKKPDSIEDIFQNDDLGLLGTEADDIFNLTNIPKTPTAPDYIAQRKACHNFHEFEGLFMQCQAALAAGKRELLPFANEQQIEQGDFFILKGVLTYVAEVGQKELTKGKTNARLLCIFENGTESNMLLRSLARELYKDGKRVTTHQDRLLDSLKGIEDGDRETGYIYIAKSLSQEPDIRNISHLYKIGFSRVPVEERIKNAAQKPTFLMAPVSIIAIYQSFNLNPQKFELLLHKFFGNACLDIDVFDQNSKRHTPREWFIAPLDVIDRAVRLLDSGEIINYQYNPNQKQILPLGANVL